MQVLYILHIIACSLHRKYPCQAPDPCGECIAPHHLWLHPLFFDIKMDLTDRIETTSCFVLDAPPGEVWFIQDSVTKWSWHLFQLNAVLEGLYTTTAQAQSIKGYFANFSTDIRNLVPDAPEVLQGLGPALEQHNKEQLTAVKLPGVTKSVGILAVGG